MEQSGGRPPRVSAEGHLTAKVSVDGRGERAGISGFSLELSEAARVRFGTQPPVESDDPAVKVFWFRAMQAWEIDQLWQERSAEQVRMLFKERGTLLQDLGDGFFTCPRCTVEGWLPECRLCDGDNSVTLRRIEDWNDQNPDEAWYVGDESEPLPCAAS